MLLLCSVTYKWNASLLLKKKKKKKGREKKIIKKKKNTNKANDKEDIEDES